MSEFTAWEAELCHFGILGMRWGVRRHQNKDGSLTTAGLRRYARLEKKRINLDLKTEKRRLSAERKKNRYLNQANSERAKVKKLSDEELKKRIDRLKLEQEYKDLKNDHPFVKLGFNAVSGIIKSMNEHEQRKLKTLELQTQQLNSKANAVRAIYEAKKERMAFKKAKQERKLYETPAKFKEAKKELKLAKVERKERLRKLKDSTIRGVIRKALVTRLGGKDERYNKELKGKQAALQILNIDYKIKNFDKEHPDSK